MRDGFVHFRRGAYVAPCHDVAELHEFFAERNVPEIYAGDLLPRHGPAVLQRFPVPAVREVQNVLFYRCHDAKHRFIAVPERHIDKNTHVESLFQFVGNNVGVINVV